MKVAIIDYNVGNVASLGYALNRAGYDAELTSDPKKIRNAHITILPGVGAVRDALKSLENTGLIPTIQQRVKEGNLLAGICLGMQMLYEVSYEDGHYPCLGFLPGEIKRFETTLKVPHMGWNELVFRKAHPMADNLPEEPYVYFVHSYLKQPALTEEVIAVADYGQPVPAIVGKENVLGMQFHPEKSGAVGEQLLKNLKNCL